MTTFKLFATMAIFIAVASWYWAMQQYTLNGKVATKGIIFQKTLNLSVYKQVAKGNGIFGKYERYSRSDRHNEVITVYKW